MCWRGGGRNGHGHGKRDIDLDAPHYNGRNPVVAVFEEHDYRRPQYYDQHPYHHQYSDMSKQSSLKPRTVARPISTKRTSSASTGNTTDTRSTQGGSTESPSLPRSRRTNQSQGSRSSAQRVHQSQSSQQAAKIKLPPRSPMKKKQVVPKISVVSPSVRPIYDPKNDMYVAIKHDNETITEISMPDMGMGFEEGGDYFEDDSRLSQEYASRSTDFRSFRSSSEFSDINGFTSYQPDGVLEATILRSDSDSTRDMSVLGAEAHVTVYNLSERMSYDLREAGRNVTTFATRLAHACIANPKLIKK